MKGWLHLMKIRMEPGFLKLYKVRGKIMDCYEKLIKAVFENELHDVNDCLELGADVSQNNNEALRIAEIELYSAKSSVVRNEAVIKLLRSAKNG
jgi:hypothetical protein